MDVSKIEQAAFSTFEHLTANVGQSNKAELSSFIAQAIRAAFEAYEAQKQE